jgi:peptidoglycan/xylan/chitin deacetylase (PgdA/CDA1 family)
MKDKTSVLTYHRVISEELAPLANSSPGIVVSEGTFEMHMRTLRRHFTPISLAEFQEHLVHNTALPRRSCLVTFDDGWLDNYEVAFPILKKYKIPATIFLPTDYISSDSMFWQEEVLMRLTNFLTSEENSDPALLSKILDNFTNAGAIDIETIRDFVIDLKRFPDDRINEVLEELRGHDNTDSTASHCNRYLTWEQISEMSAAGITFGSHTLSHRILCRLSDEQCRSELLGSRSELQNRLALPVRAIAYPNGDHDERVICETKAAGYTLAFTTNHDLAGRNVDPFAVPRVNIHENNAGSEARFMCACVGLF